MTSILACFAHPDDEAFTCGGTLSHYAAAGTEVNLLCATRGEAGEISDPTLATPETLGSVREGELRCACQALGINAPIFFDYRDSGMAGTPENKDPSAFHNAPAAEVVPRLVRLIRRVKPQVILTFDPEGGYGHPDHIAIHRHTVSALHAAADASQYPEYGAAWQAERLYYVVLPRSFFQSIYEYLVEAGVDTTELQRFRERAGWPDEAVDLVQNVAPVIETKWRAFFCHQTQINPNSPFRKVPDDLMKGLVSREHFVLAWPETTPKPSLTGLL